MAFSHPVLSTSLRQPCVPVCSSLTEGRVWLPWLPASRRWFSGGRGARVAYCSWSKSLWCFFLGSGLSALLFSLFFLPHPSGIRAYGSSLCSCSFCAFPTHLIHLSSCIDRGELPGIAVLRTRLCLAAPRYLLPRRDTGNPHRVDRLHIRRADVLYTSS